MRVKVIMCVYNQAPYVEVAIASVLAQSWTDFMMEIIDDCSTDQSFRAIEKASGHDARVRFRRNERNQGLAENLRSAIERDDTDFIAFLEGDDIWPSGFLRAGMEVLGGSSEIALAYGRCEPFGADREYVSSKHDYVDNVYSLVPWNEPFKAGKLIMDQNIIPTFSCVIIRREAIAKADFSPPVGPWFDWWLWMQVLSAHESYFMAEQRVAWRIHKRSFNASFTENFNKVLRNVSLQQKTYARRFGRFAFAYRMIASLGLSR